MGDLGLSQPVAPRRLEGWQWTLAEGRRCVSGKIFDDPPPRSEPDGTEMWVPVATAAGSVAEGATVRSSSGKQYVLGVAAVSPRRALAGLVDQFADKYAETRQAMLDQRAAAEAELLRRRTTPAAAQPRGHVPAGGVWDGWAMVDGKQGAWVDVTTGDLIELGGSKRKRKRPGAKVVVTLTDEQEKHKAEKEEARQAKEEAYQEEVEAWKAKPHRAH